MIYGASAPVGSGTQISIVEDCGLVWRLPHQSSQWPGAGEVEQAGKVIQVTVNSDVLLMSSVFLSALVRVPAALGSLGKGPLVMCVHIATCSTFC